MPPTVWTVGHSTHSLAEFLQLLEAHDIQVIADVRRHPGSSRRPHFAGSRLARTLRRRDIDYAWLPELGGRRRPRPDSRNTAWRNAAFRGYADHMETETFELGLAALVSLAYGARTAILCAEATWWRCHRGLIADVLCWLGFPVLHIMSPTSARAHPFTAAAHIRGGLLSYAA